MSSALIGVQQWMFLWAPLNGAGLAVSNGYFLLPLTMILTGRIVYKEKLTTLQILAGLTAAVGVGHEVYQTGAIAWETALVMFGFPAYFVLRRTLKIDHLGGLWFDLALVSPVAAYFMVDAYNSQAIFETLHIYILLVGLAILCVAGFVTYILASRLLSLGVFGLMGYVEPVLLVAASLLLGEALTADKLLTYVPIWMSVALLATNGIVHMLRYRSNKVVTGTLS